MAYDPRQPQLNPVQEALEYRRLANTNPLKLMQLQNQMKMPMVNRAIPGQVGDGGKRNNQMETIKNKMDMIGPLALSNLVDISLGAEAKKDVEELEEQEKLDEEKKVEKAIQVLESPLLTRIRGGLSAYGKYFTVMDFGEEELSLILH